MTSNKLAIITALAFLFSVQLIAQEQDPSADLKIGDDIASEAEKKADEAVKAAEEKETAEAKATGREDGASTGGTDTAGKEDETVTTDTPETTTAKSDEARTFSDGKATYATCATKFELESGDQMSSLSFIEYRVDDSPLRKYRGPFEIEQEGLHRVVYRGVDKVGNLEPQQMYEVIIDCTAPEVSLSTNPAYYEADGLLYLPSGSSLDIKAVDKYSGVDKIQYSLNGGQFQDYSGKITLDKEGQQTIKYKAIDKLGNTSAELTFSAIIDGTAPELKIKTSLQLVTVDSKKYSKRENIFTVVSSDTTSGLARVLVKLDGGQDFQPYSTPINFSVEGPHSIEVKAIDNVGNETEVKKVEFLTDDNPPKTTIKAVNISTGNSQ